MSNYPGYYQTYDAGHIDEDGYVWIMSRTDDIINVAGHRLSTGAIEEVLAEHKNVAECAVIGIEDKFLGENICAFVRLKKDHCTNVEEIKENSNIQIITKNKNDQDILYLLEELIEEHKEQANLKKIESLEQKLINNLDENSYSELIKLKSQLNRE